ncbi:MAG: Tat pathway signal protein [Paracoccaceae bacterium]
MLSRRNVIAAGGVLAAAAALTTFDWSSAYGELVDTIWAPARAPANPDLAFLVRHATLAANNHNVQPWLFSGDTRRVLIAPDLARTTPVVDPENHHLFVSLGCAAENLAIAAGAAGKATAITLTKVNAVQIDLEGTTQGEPALFAAITARQSTRSEFDGRAVDAATLRLLEKAAAIQGIDIRLVTAKPEMERVLEQAVAANTAQIKDPAFVAELKSWLRFSERDAAFRRDGLFSGCSGNPNLPPWIGTLAFGFAFTAEAENDKLARQVRSSAGLAIVVSAKDDPAHWVNAGRGFQRFALQSTALGLRHAVFNQPVEVRATRATLSQSLGLGAGRPDMVVRFGYAPPMPRSLRRPVEDVIRTA